MNFQEKVSHYLNLSQDNKIITEEQKKKILALIEEESSHIGFMKILSVIGAICIGTWVILIIASNWSELPRLIKLLLALSLPVISLLIGYYFSYVQKDLKILGYSFTFLGWLLLWATITLIWQIYNLDGTVWSLTLMWFFLTLPLVFVFRLKTLALLAAVLFYTTSYYYISEVIFARWNDEYVLTSFTIISSLVAVWSYSLNSFSKQTHAYMLTPITFLSLKILFFLLFIGTIDSYFTFLGPAIVHHILFLWVLSFIMYWANKNKEILLRHSTFVWLSLYIVVQYFDLFHNYLSGWLFFITTWLLLIALVYTTIKITNRLDKKSDNTSS